jgi:hypothetical protein
MRTRLSEHAADADAIIRDAARRGIAAASVRMAQNPGFNIPRMPR